MTDRVYIYALRDCNSANIRYVGQTIDPRLRLAAHTRDGDADSSNAKSAWIGSVLSQGGTIEMDILEECDYDNAGEREAFWMSHCREAGHLLTNAGPAQRKVKRLQQQGRAYPLSISSSDEDFDEEEIRRIAKLTARMEAVIESLAEMKQMLRQLLRRNDAPDY